MQHTLLKLPKITYSRDINNYYPEILSVEAHKFLAALHEKFNAERLALGAELGFLNKVFFRTGYEFGIEEVSWPSFGLGLNTEWQGTALTADLSYTFYERLGNLPRFALKFGF
jgi:hypothetical protein